MKIISLFAGCGGLDLGFQKAGFDVVWANEYDKNIWETYEKNHKTTFLDKRDLNIIPSTEIPDAIGVIGGPPCQSWSAAGKNKGVDDARGRLFFEFIRVINDKNPLFFVAENVSGMLFDRHKDALNTILERLKNAGEYGYNVTPYLVNASDYGVPQNRIRVFFIGYRKDIDFGFTLPDKNFEKRTVLDAIGDIVIEPLQSKYGSTNGENCIIANHEYSLQSYSYIFMSRNRVLSWDKPSYTIQASGRHIPIHPKAPKMVKVAKDVMEFVKGKEHLYRRLSVRECAKIQTFPDSFTFYYENIENAYKMIGNAVPVQLAYSIANVIYDNITIKNYNYVRIKDSFSVDMPI